MYHRYSVTPESRRAVQRSGKPVSYTHLEGQIDGTEVVALFSGVCKAVSYTHLDVYKRQPVERVYRLRDVAAQWLRYVYVGNC